MNFKQERVSSPLMNEKHEWKEEEVAHASSSILHHFCPKQQAQAHSTPNPDRPTRSALGWERSPCRAKLPEDDAQHLKTNK